MLRTSAITRRILSQNRARDFDRLTLKCAQLRQDPFAFFRGTNPLFLEFLPRAHALFKAPRTLICGDLHLENFGAFKGDNRLCYFDINDFDEACLAPLTLDIVRFVTGVKVAARGLGLNRTRCRLLVRSFLLAYIAAIRDGKPRWIERSLATGVFRALLRRAMRRSRSDLLNRFTKLKGGRRSLKIDGVRALALDGTKSSAFAGVLSQLEVPGSATRSATRRFFALEGAARRIAGNGSLGLERYMLLVHGRGGPDGQFVLDMKFAAPSAVIGWLKRPQPAWSDDAARVIDVQKIMQAIAPAMLDAVKMNGRSFVLKELQPSIDRLNLASWRKKMNRSIQAIEGMGRVTAWAHLRGCGHHGAASVETLQAYVAGAGAAGKGAAAHGWVAATERLSDAAAVRIQRAWQAYSKDYDSGAVGAAIAPKAARAGRSRATAAAAGPAVI